MAKLIQFSCPHCGGLDVGLDASARWNFKKQRWVLSGTNDNAWCRECDAEEIDLVEFYSVDGLTKEGEGK